MFYGLISDLEKWIFNKKWGATVGEIPDNETVATYSAKKSFEQIEEKVNEIVENKTGVSFLKEFWEWAKNNAVLVLAAFFGILFIKRL